MAGTLSWKNWIFCCFVNCFQGLCRAVHSVVQSWGCECTPKSFDLSKIREKFLKIRVQRFRPVCSLLSCLTFFLRKKHFWSSASVRITEHKKSSCHFQASVQWFEAEQRLTKGCSLDSSHHIYHLPLHQTFVVFGCLRTSTLKTPPAPTRDVEAEAEAGSGSGESGPFSVEAEARKFYRFRFHIGYLTWGVTWRKSFVHFPMWIKQWSCTVSVNERAISVARENEIKHN